MVHVGYQGLQGYTRDYNGLQKLTRVYIGIQGFTEVYKSSMGIIGIIMGWQEDYIMAYHELYANCIYVKARFEMILCSENSFPLKKEFPCDQEISMIQNPMSGGKI